MASEVLKMRELTLTNNTHSKTYTVVVPTSVFHQCESDPETASIVYAALERGYPIVSAGKRNLSVQESLAVVLDLGLVSEWAEKSKGNGVTIGKDATFDRITRVASELDESLDDTVINTIGRLAPRGLTSREKVRFMEYAVASLSDAPSASTSGPSPLIPAPSTAESQETQEEVNIPGGSQSEAPDTERVHWTHEAVLLLVELRRQLEATFTSSTVSVKQAWRKVAERMNERGHKYSAADCDKKFRNMKLRYKKNKENNSRTGNSRSTWRYYDIMDDLFRGDPAVEPLVAVGSMGVAEVNSEPALVFSQLPETPQKAPSQQPVRRTPAKKRRRDDDLLPQIRDDLMQIHKDRMQLETRRVEALERMVALLEKHFEE